jgi:redox-sensitive bicupin YhaK (pirin superfamily)
MKVIRASTKYPHGNDVFHIEILYPGTVLGGDDTGFYTIGRIDHANFRPPGLVPMHKHQDDEILSYMRSGSQEHKDTAGNKEIIHASKLMLMNAGSGVSHEEKAEQDLEMLQIFMRPSENGLVPKVQFHEFETIYSENQWRLVAGNDKNAPLQLRVDTNIFDIRLRANKSIAVPATPGVFNFLYCFAGSVSVGDELLTKGDCIIFENEQPRVQAIIMSDLVLFQINVNAIYSDSGMFSGNQRN